MTQTTVITELAIQALEDLKGVDILAIDVRKLTTITDTMIICSGTSDRHVKSLAKNLENTAKAAGFRPLGLGGADTGEWALVDLGDVLIHVMQPKIRELYNLEQLWTDPEADRAANA